MTDTQPLITIGITCYGAADTIGRAITSALKQNWSNLELIIVDDRSIDKSVQIVREAISGVGHARLIEHERNRGAAAARNSLIQAARGEFIAFFDDDDESDANRLAVQYERIREYEQSCGAAPIACYASGAREYPNGYRLQLDAIGSRGRGPIGLEVVDYLLVNDRHDDVFYGAGTPTCSLMARTAALRAIGGFDENLRRVEDVDLAIRLGFAGAHFIGCREKLYLQHATIASDKTPSKNLEAELFVVEKHQSYLKKRGLFRYAKSWFQFRHSYFTRKYLRAFAQFVLIFAFFPVRATRHIFRSAPSRIRHDQFMRAQPFA